MASLFLATISICLAARLILCVCANLRGMQGNTAAFTQLKEFSWSFTPAPGQRSGKILTAMSASGTNQGLHRAWVGSACNGFTWVPNTVSNWQPIGWKHIQLVILHKCLWTSGSPWNMPAHVNSSSRVLVGLRKRPLGKSSSVLGKNLPNVLNNKE